MYIPSPLLKEETNFSVRVGDLSSQQMIEQLYKKKKISKGIDECINKIDIEYYIQQQQNAHSFKMHVVCLPSWSK